MKRREFITLLGGAARVADRGAGAAAGGCRDRRAQQPDPRNRERKNWGRSPRVERDRLRRGSKRGDRVSASRTAMATADALGLGHSR